MRIKVYGSYNFCLVMNYYLRSNGWKRKYRWNDFDSNEEGY